MVPTLIFAHGRADSTVKTLEDGLHEPVLFLRQIGNDCRISISQVWMCMQAHPAG